MNKKGAVFAIMTVIFVFIFIFGNLIYKTHIENKIKIRDVGLNSIDLLRQRNDFEFDSYFVKKEIEYNVNNALFEFIQGGGNSYSDFEKFLREKDLGYKFSLVGDVLEFEIEGSKGLGRIIIRDCKNKVVDLVKKQVGCNYLLGAKGQSVTTNNPCKRIFDCSGLVKWVYKNADVGIYYFPDGSWIQADWGRRKNLVVSNEIGKGAKLDVNVLESGDVVFFKGILPTDGDGLAADLGIRHVGIYLGDGKMIEAVGEDRGVIESNIAERSDYRGAIRICSENFEGKKGIFSKDFKYRYKIDIEKKKFVTFEGLKSLT